MPAKKPIGYLKCFCGFPDAEVKTDKNDNPYFYCPDCSLQMLTHGGSRGKVLTNAMRPVLEPEPAIDNQEEKTPGVSDPGENNQEGKTPGVSPGEPANKKRSLNL